MFQVLILICAASIPRAECQAKNALDIVLGPLVKNEVMCAFHGQAYIATTAMRPRSAMEYEKIRCLPQSKVDHILHPKAEGH
jgi:hypothetical protein